MPPTTVELTCAQCGAGFEREARKERERIKKGRTGPFCRPVCARRAGPPPPWKPNSPRDPVDSFMEKFRVVEGGCWEWTASVGSHGYGQLTVNGGPMLAHRFAYEQFHDCVIRDGLELHHVCENRACVFPLHLEALTTAEHGARHSNSRAAA